MHILLLWPDAARRESARVAGAIEATLRPLEAPAPPGEIVSARPVPARPASPQTASVAAPTAVPPAPTFATPPVPAINASTGSGIERSPPLAPVTAAASTAVSTGTETPASTGTATGGGGAGVDADGLRQYRLALAREARRYKRYPERALLAGIGGTVEVRIELGAGAMPVTRLARSSGNDSLDVAALEMMRMAAPRTVVPEPLRGRTFAVSLPVIFDASEE